MGVKRKIKKSAGADLITINNAFEEYCVEKEAKGLAAKTIENYRQSFSYFMDFHSFTDETTTDAINQGQFFHWINDMKIEGVSNASINHYLRDCRAFVYWCMDETRKYITPAFKVELVKGQEEPLKLFSDEELERLLDKPKANDSFVEWRTWTIVSWVLATGNRASTICEVKINDIDFKKQEIVLRATKNKKLQIIPLSSSLSTTLKEYIRIWRKEAGADGWLFPNIGEDKLTTNALRHSFAKYCEDRKVEKTNIHGLRHNFAKGWVKNNGNMFALQKILGHSSLEMTKRYVRLFNDDIKQEYNQFAPLDTIKKNQKRTKLVERN